MRIVATAFLLLLTWSVDAAHAAPVTFEVEYTTLYNEYCFFHSGICVPRSLDSFTRTFTLLTNWEIHEYVCNEFNIDVEHLVGK